MNTYFSYEWGINHPTHMIAAENAREAFEKYIENCERMSFYTGMTASADYITYFESQDECAGLVDFISRSDPKEDYTGIILIKRSKDCNAYE